MLTAYPAGQSAPDRIHCSFLFVFFSAYSLQIQLNGSWLAGLKGWLAGAGCLFDEDELLVAGNVQAVFRPPLCMITISLPSRNSSLLYGRTVDGDTTAVAAKLGFGSAFMPLSWLKFIIGFHSV